MQCQGCQEHRDSSYCTSESVKKKKKYPDESTSFNQITFRIHFISCETCIHKRLAVVHVQQHRTSIYMECGDNPNLVQLIIKCVCSPAEGQHVIHTLNVSDVFAHTHFKHTLTLPADVHTRSVRTFFYLIWYIYHRVRDSPAMYVDTCMQIEYEMRMLLLF